MLYIELDEFVIMPNHVYGVIIISTNLMGTADDIYNNEAESSRRADCWGTTDDVSNNKAGSSRRAPTERFGSEITMNILFVMNVNGNELNKTLSIIHSTDRTMAKYGKRIIYDHPLLHHRPARLELLLRPAR